jgi:hypothetical protein
MFSNGTEYHVFMERYCFRCSKYKSDKEGIPSNNSCSIEKEIAAAMFEPDTFPYNNVYYKDGQGYTCNKFKDKTEQRQYKKRNVKQVEGQIKLL